MLGQKRMYCLTHPVNRRVRRCSLRHTELASPLPPWPPQDPTQETGNKALFQKELSATAHIATAKKKNTGIPTATCQRISEISAPAFMKQMPHSDFHKHGLRWKPPGCVQQTSHEQSSMQQLSSSYQYQAGPELVQHGYPETVEQQLFAPR